MSQFFRGLEKVHSLGRYEALEHGSKTFSDFDRRLTLEERRVEPAASVFICILGAFVEINRHGGHGMRV